MVQKLGYDNINNIGVHEDKPQQYRKLLTYKTHYQLQVEGKTDTCLNWELKHLVIEDACS